ncbi:hypothetical protein ZMO02_02110 [Zymomonas mobilis subsp. pomaceae]|nr:hypothetical protein ZMO02_02110 [Zymomonas mobilis subsp. pomaceae]
MKEKGNKRQYCFDISYAFYKIPVTGKFSLSYKLCAYKENALTGESPDLYIYCKKYFP